MNGKRFFVLLLFTGILLVTVSFLIFGSANTWRIWNIPVKLPAFYDLRLITAGAESYSHGYDPAYDNPYDPEQRLFNYPRIWYLLLASGITQQSTEIIGILLIGGFVVGNLVVFRKLDNITAIALILILFSPAILLGIERGNVDVLIFTLLAFALFFMNYSKWASVLILIFASVLKIYPIFGIGCFVENDKRSAKYIVTSILAIAAYMFFSMRDMQHIFVATQKGADVSYGVSVFIEKISAYLGIDFGTMKIVAYGFAAGMILVAGYLAVRKSGQKNTETDDLLKLFRLSAGIYIGTFMLGNNWDYRLVFLVLSIPQLIAWARNNSGIFSLVAKFSLVAVFVSCWYLEIWRLADLMGLYGRIASFMIDELSNWTLFACLVYLYIASLPRWLTDFVPKQLYQRFPHHQQNIES